MVLFDAITWWYSWAWLHVLEVTRRRLTRLYNVFSVRQMLRTLFQPWKEDRVTGAQGLDQILRALVMNTVARFIGLCIRLIFLGIYVLSSLFIGATGLVVFVVWPVLPISSIILLIIGVSV